MRDLDELLDPAVSRRASAAARTPDFAAVERRGHQRRRRARVMAVGAVAAVVAAVSVVGTQVASDRSDTAPAVPPGYDDPNGELERAAEAGRADVMAATVGAGDTAVTVWRQVVFGEDGLPKDRYGFSLATDGETLWSPLEAPVGIQRSADFFASPLPDGGFVVTRSMGSAAKPAPVLLADADGLRALELRTAPADLSTGEYDGFVVAEDRRGNGGVYAVDRETNSLAPVAEVAGVQPVWMEYFRGLAPTLDGDAWAVTWRGTNLIRLASDGAVSRYPFEGTQVGLVVGDDGRAAVLSSEDGRTVLANVVEDGDMSTHELWTGPRARAAEAIQGSTVLSDGRLLVHAGNTLLRSTDASWRGVEDLGVVGDIGPARFAALTLQQVGDRACLVPGPTQLGGPKPQPEAYCTTDGETWTPVDLAP